MGNKPHRVIDLGTLTISSGTSASGSMDFTGWRGAAEKISIQGPDTLGGTITVEVSDDDSTWVVKQSAGADINIGVDESITIESVDWRYMRIASTVSEGADRNFIVRGVEGQS